MNDPTDNVSAIEIMQKLKSVKEKKIVLLYIDEYTIEQ